MSQHLQEFCTSWGLLLAGQHLAMCDLSLWYFVSNPLADLRVWQEESYQLCLALCPTFNYETFHTY